MKSKKYKEESLIKLEKERFEKLSQAEFWRRATASIYQQIKHCFDLNHTGKKKP